jgi:hypothetical protein
VDPPEAALREVHTERAGGETRQARERQSGKHAEVYGGRHEGWDQAGPGCGHEQTDRRDNRPQRQGETPSLPGTGENRDDTEDRQSQTEQDRALGRLAEEDARHPIVGEVGGERTARPINDQSIERTTGSEPGPTPRQEQSPPEKES